MRGAFKAIPRLIGWLGVIRASTQGGVSSLTLAKRGRLEGDSGMLQRLHCSRAANASSGDAGRFPARSRFGHFSCDEPSGRLGRDHAVRQERPRRQCRAKGK